jgi:hypothetical protein
MRVSARLLRSPIVRRENDSWENPKAISPIHRLKHLLTELRREEGSALVEFALTFVVFLLLVFSVIDFGHLFFVKMDAQNAMQEAARYGSTGNHLPDPNNPNNTLSRVSSITDTLQNEANGIQFSNIQISSLTGGSGSAGGPGDMLTISAEVNMPLLTPLIARIFPGGNYTFTENITIMNEPFPAGETN